MTSEKVHNRLDELEVALLQNFPPAECELKHEFEGGMYRRTILMYAGSTWTTVTHNKDHFYFVLTGKANVFDEQNGTVTLQAPDFGVTKKGTRRVLEILEDMIFATVHVTDIVPENDSEEAKAEAGRKVVEEVTENRINHVLGARVINNEIQPNLIKE